MDQQFKTLNVQLKDRILSIEIHRPDKLNALSSEVMSELLNLLKDLKEPKFAEIRGALLIGSGHKAFIAGADIKEMALKSADEGEAFGQLGQQVTNHLEALPFPVIACVDGFALGGGCEMAMACDFIYSTVKSEFGQPEVNLGLIPGFGGCVRLPRYVGLAKAKELIYTGQRISAAEAHEIGLVNKVFDTRSEMLIEARETLMMVQSRSPHAVKICKEVINCGVGEDTTKALEIEKFGFRQAFLSPDKEPGIQAFLEKRVPHF